MRDLWHIWEREVTSYDEYAVIPNFLTDEECDRFIAVQDGHIAAESEGWGPVAGGDEYYPGVPGQEVNFQHRKVKASWIPRMDNDLQDLVYRKGIAVNEKHFGFDVDAMQDLQLCRYGEGEYFYPHYDSFASAPRFEHRKLSISVLINQPEDFEGYIDLYFGEKPVRIKHAERGTAVAFPAWALHGVEPVDKGERRVLIAWFTGEKYR